jgi:hypothetical protein
MSNIFSRQCQCGNLVTYTTQKACNYAKKHVSRCKKCRRVGTTHNPETRQYLASIRKGTLLSHETKQKIGDAHRGERSVWFGRHHTNESKQKMSISHTGKTFSPEHSAKIAKANTGKHHTAEYKKKASERLKGRVVSSETCVKMRQAAIRRVIEQFGTTSYNKDACAFIDDLNDKLGWNLQHALNGGEKEICGYLVDGYDKSKNIVFEYDESQHFTFDGKLRVKDIIRQNNIISSLKCEFYRYDAVRKRFYKVNSENCG